MVNNRKMRYVTLIATQDCNLSCVYCYEHHKTRNSFNVELAKSIISEELDRNEDIDEISFEFFGGEPFLEFEKIREIVEYFSSKRFNKDFHFFAGTNATLITTEIKEWLVRNQDIFQLALSLDGTKEMHDANRSHSFDSIDIDFFLREFTNIIVKATISPGTLGGLSDGIKFLHAKGFKNISCNLAVGVNWSSEINVILLQRELNKLIEYYLENPQLKPCTILNYSVENAAHPNDGKAMKYCGAGTRTRVYDIDGKVYPCQYFLPMTIGDKADTSKEVAFMDKMDISELDIACQTCVAVNICPSCYGSNYQDYDNIHKRDEAFCKLQKIIILANSFFKAKQWKLGQLKLDEFSEQELLYGIMRIQHELK